MKAEEARRLKRGDWVTWDAPGGRFTAKVARAQTHSDWNDGMVCIHRLNGHSGNRFIASSALTLLDMPPSLERTSLEGWLGA